MTTARGQWHIAPVALVDSSNQDRKRRPVPPMPHSGAKMLKEQGLQQPTEMTPTWGSTDIRMHNKPSSSDPTSMPPPLRMLPSTLRLSVIRHGESTGPPSLPRSAATKLYSGVHAKTLSRVRTTLEKPNLSLHFLQYRFSFLYTCADGPGCSKAETKPKISATNPKKTEQR